MLYLPMISLKIYKWSEWNQKNENKLLLYWSDFISNNKWSYYSCISIINWISSLVCFVRCPLTWTLFGKSMFQFFVHIFKQQLFRIFFYLFLHEKLCKDTISYLRTCTPINTGLLFSITFCSHLSHLFKYRGKLSSNW